MGNKTGKRKGGEETEKMHPLKTLENKINSTYFSTGKGTIFHTSSHIFAFLDHGSEIRTDSSAQREFSLNHQAVSQSQLYFTGKSRHSIDLSSHNAKALV